MTNMTREEVLAAHALSECVTLSLPPLRARNHGEAVAVLNARRAALLEHADYLTFLASAFSDVPEVVSVLIAEIESALIQARSCAPKSVSA